MQREPTRQDIKQGVSGDRVRSLWTPRETHVDPSLPAWKRKYWEDVKALKQKKQAQIEGPENLGIFSLHASKIYLVLLTARVSQSGSAISVHPKNWPRYWDHSRNGASRNPTFSILIHSSYLHSICDFGFEWTIDPVLQTQLVPYGSLRRWAVAATTCNRRWPTCPSLCNR